MSQALYRKWRPRLWEQVVGQEHVVRTLQNALRSERIGHAYLFAGPRGTGKTTTARLLAKAVNCLSPELGDRPCDQCEYCQAVNDGRFLDLIEIDAASNTSVDDVRDLRDKINYAPTLGRYKVYIIDEVHMLSTAAFNALLKTLEEPPPHAIFILATTEVHKIPATVLSRCQRHEFRRIPVQAIVQLLRKMSDEEGLQIDDAALTLIARQATGALRDGISLLDQLASTGEKITLEMAQNVLGTAASQMVIDLVDAILARQAAPGLECIHRSLDSGTDPRQFARQVVEYLRSLMVIRLGNADQVDATAEIRAQMAKHAQAFDLPHLLETLRLFNAAANEVRTGWQPGLLLELALAEVVEPKPVTVQSVVAPVAPAAQPVEAPDAPAARPQPATNVETPVHSEQPSSPPPAPKASRQPARQPAEKPEDQPPPPEEPEGQPSDEPVEKKALAEISEADIRKNWDRIRSLVRQRRGQTEALLNSCKSMTIRNGVLVLGFASDIVKEKMENNDNLQLTQKAIAQAVGVEIPVACVVIDAKTKAVPTDLNVDAGGMVSAALDLGAEIVQKE